MLTSFGCYQPTMSLLPLSRTPKRMHQCFYYYRMWWVKLVFSVQEKPECYLFAWHCPTIQNKKRGSFRVNRGKRFLYGSLPLRLRCGVTFYFCCFSGFSSCSTKDSKYSLADWWRFQQKKKLRRDVIADNAWKWINMNNHGKWREAGIPYPPRKFGYFFEELRCSSQFHTSLPFFLFYCGWSVFRLIFHTSNKMECNFYDMSLVHEILNNGEGLTHTKTSRRRHISSTMEFKPEAKRRINIRMHALGKLTHLA